ncbi:MAG: glycosyltransferase family 4 protein [Methylophilaceae bacterium]
MNVLIWTQYFWPENFHINTIARCLHDRGAKVTILTGKPNYPEGEFFTGYRGAGISRETFSGFEVFRIPIKPRKMGSAKDLVFNYLSFIFSGYLFAPFALREKKFDVIFIYAPSPLLQALPALFFARLRRIPTVLWVQDIWPEALQATGYIRNRWILRMVSVAVRVIYRYSDSILIQSEEFRASVERMVNDKQKILYYPNSADDTSVDLMAEHSSRGIAKEVAQGFSIVFAGNIGSAQSCETIIEAAKLLQGSRDVKFYMVGSGSQATALAESIMSNKLENVVMTGRVPPEEMASIYAAASVLLVSLRDDPALSATIPSKLQSYLSAGKPIIVSCNGASTDVVLKANAGLTCPAGDAVALAEAVVRFYEMLPEQRDVLGKNGREYFKANYHLPARMEELETHLRTVIAHSRN